MDDMNHILIAWGWNEFWANQAERFIAQGMIPARVANGKHKLWTVQTAQGKRQAQVAPGATHSAVSSGDWIVVQPGPTSQDPVVIHDVLPRRSKLSSHEIGENRQEKLIAANVDKIWFVHGLDAALNLSRIERYLEVARQSSALPEIILTKRDRVDDLESIIEKIKSRYSALNIRPVNSNNAESVRGITVDFRQGETICIVGPADAGKATLINALASTASNAEISIDAPRGLMRLPGGACLLDTQSIRDMRIWIMEEGLVDAFPDIDALAKKCRFKDCGHSLEPGCAVIAAVETGVLDRQRLKNFRKLQEETAQERHGEDDETPISSTSLWDNIKKRVGRN